MIFHFRLTIAKCYHYRLVSKFETSEWDVMHSYDTHGVLHGVALVTIIQVSAIGKADE